MIVQVYYQYFPSSKFASIAILLEDQIFSGVGILDISTALTNRMTASEIWRVPQKLRSLAIRTAGYDPKPLFKTSLNCTGLL